MASASEDKEPTSSAADTVLQGYFNTTKAIYFKQIVDKYKEKLDFESRGNTSLVDIGTGAARELMLHMVPNLPDKFKTIFGVDKSLGAITLAKKQYDKHVRKPQFRVVNIEANSVPISDRFDYATSFWCMHLVRNQQRAMQNIYTLLNPGGCVLMSFVVKSIIFQIFQKLAASPSWCKYIPDVSIGISPYQDSEDPVGEITKHLKDAGFTNITVDLTETVYAFNKLETYEARIRSLNEFEKNIPGILVAGFYNDFLAELLKHDYVTRTENPCTILIKIPALLVNVIATKPLTQETTKKTDQVVPETKGKSCGTEKMDEE